MTPQADFQTFEKTAPKPFSGVRYVPTAPDSCCPVCWHRHGRSISINCTDHSTEEKYDYRNRENRP